MRRSKGEIERDYFDRFRRVFGGPQGHAEYGDKPDVVVKGELIVGVEITQLYLVPGGDPASEQRQRRLRASVVSAAQAIFTKSGGPPIEWTVGFRPGALRLGSTQKVADALAAFALSFANGVSGEVGRELYRSVLPEVSFLYVNRTEYSAPLWRVSQVHNSGLISPAVVQAAIDTKEAKAAAYVGCHALWLLIVVEPMDPAQDQEIRLEELAACSSAFERVLIYKPTFEHVVDVDLKSAGVEQ